MAFTKSLKPITPKPKISINILIQLNSILKHEKLNSIVLDKLIKINTCSSNKISIEYSNEIQ